MKKVYLFFLALSFFAAGLIADHFFFSKNSTSNIVPQVSVQKEVPLQNDQLKVSTSSQIATTSLAVKENNNDKFIPPQIIPFQNPYERRIVDLGIYFQHSKNWGGKMNIDQFAFVKTPTGIKTSSEDCYRREKDSVGSCVFYFETAPKVQFQVTTNNITSDNFFLHGNNGGFGGDMTLWIPPAPHEINISNFCERINEPTGSLAAKSKDLLSCQKVGEDTIVFERLYEDTELQETFRIYGIFKEINNKITPFTGVFARMEKSESSSFTDEEKNLLYSITQSFYFDDID